MATPEMLCQMLGISASPMAAAAMPEGCCAEAEPAKSAPGCEDDCCEVEVGYQKLEPVSNIHLAHFDFALPPAAFVSFAAVFSSLNFRHTQAVLQYADSSPPLYGRDLLRSIELLLI